MRPFRFGVQAFSASSAGEWTELARSAEDLGYSCLHLADHYLGPGAAAEAANHPPQGLAAIPAMMAAAASTETIRVGARVMCVDYHHPLVLAKSLATIDLLSDGRLEAGFGAGWIASEYEAMGIAMDLPGKRIDRLVEHVLLARAFFAGEELALEGEHVRVTSMTAEPVSPQPGGPPIMIGGGSPRVLRTAGQLADIVSINFDNRDGRIGSHGIGSGTAEETKRKLAWVAEGAGDRVADVEIEIGAYFTRVTTASQATRETMAPHLGLTQEQLATHPHALIGSIDEICETLEARRVESGISYITVPAPALVAFAPVIQRLAGR